MTSAYGDRWYDNKTILDDRSQNAIRGGQEADEIVKSIHALTAQLHQKICAPAAPPT